MAIVSRSKFADKILEEAAAFLCFVYAGLADGYVFIPVILHTADTTADTDRRLQELHRTQSTLHRDVSTARPLARGAGTQKNWGQGPGPGPPVTSERGHCGGGQLQCDAFPTVCSPSSPRSALWLFGEAVDVD